MKSFKIFALSLVTFALASAEQNPAVVCGTGDALAGVNVYINQLNGESSIEMLSQDDQQPPTVYTFTLTADQGQQLLAGQSVALVGRSPDSFDFGGATTKAVLFNLKVNTDVFSYERTSQLAEGGTVFSLFCNKAGLTPPRNAN